VIQAGRPAKHFAKASAMSAVIAVFLTSLDILAEVWQVHLLRKITLEGAAFLALYLLSLKTLRLVEPSDLEILRTALPPWLRGSIDTLEHMIV